MELVAHDSLVQTHQLPPPPKAPSLGLEVHKSEGTPDLLHSTDLAPNVAPSLPKAEPHPAPLPTPAPNVGPALQPSALAGNRPAKQSRGHQCDSKVQLIELWAGIATLSVAFAAAGISPSAFLEANPILLTRLKRLHPHAQFAGYVEDNEWQQWTFPADAHIGVVGGPSCISLSSAGKQRAGNDPSSRYLFLHLQIAAHFSAAFILLENVCYLVDGDKEHGLFSQLCAMATSLGFTLVHIWRGTDCTLGGFTQRSRVVIFWERTAISQLLPSWVPEPTPPAPHRSMDQVLLPSHSVPVSAWLAVSEQVPLVYTVSSQHARPIARFVRHSSLSQITPGSLVSLHNPRGGLNRWRVMDSHGSRIELRRSDRKNPTFALVAPSELRAGLSEFIVAYDKHGIGIGLRRWGEPPLNNGFAILDTVNGQLWPRIITPQESMYLHGQGDDVISDLQGLGATDADIAEAAGNCITRATAEAVVSFVMPRVLLLSSVGSLSLDTPTLTQCNGTRMVWLLPFALRDKPCCLIDPAAAKVIAYPLRAPGRAHQAASSIAAKQISKLCGSPHEVILCGHFEAGVAFCAPVSPLTVIPGLQWSLASEQSGDVQLLMSLAVSTALSCVPPPLSFTDMVADPSSSHSWAQAQRDLMELSVHSGARAAHSVVSHKAPTGLSGTQLERLLIQDAVAGSMLRRAIELESLQLEDKLREEFLAWADGIRPLPRSSMPSVLAQECDSFSDGTLLDIPIPDPCPPHHTRWLPRSSQPTPAPNFKPSSITDLLYPWAMQLIDDWLTVQLEFLLAIESDKTAPRKSNKALALGQDAFLPEARGIVWDLRRLSEGIIVPLDFDTPLDSHLNLELIAEELWDHPDQELVSFLLEGVRYKADIDHQIVLLPHLVSLREGYHSLKSEVEKYRKMGWYGLFDHPPFLPFRAVPKGSTPRKLEPDRPRPTTEAGAPRNLLLASDQRPVLSLNEASSGLTPEGLVSSMPNPRVSSPLWPKERKPTLCHLLVAMAFLLAMGNMLSVPLFTAADDFRNFFNQFMLSPEEYWKCGMIISEKAKAVFASEFIMTFGLRPASNIAQRFADAILEIWRKRMDIIEAPHINELRRTVPAFDLWCASQSKPIRLYAAMIYTDDPVFLVLGPERMARALRVWTTLCHELGLMMAIAAKRQCGTHAEWLGAAFSTVLGMAWVPLPKLLAALTKLEAVLNETIQVDQYHSLLGLLEHLVFLHNMKRTLMYNLWAPFQQGVALEPNKLLTVTDPIRAQCKKWHNLLSQRAAVSALRAVRRTTPSRLTTVFTLYSDAMSERHKEAGLGGWFHGYYWSLALEQPFLGLSIPVLEFIAAVVSLLTFRPTLPQLDDKYHVLHLRVDALATPYVLTDDAASSPVLVALHSFLLDRQDYAEIAALLSCSHVYGVGNEMADAASRSNFDRLNRLAVQLRISPSQLEPHPVCFELLHCALEAQSTI